MLRWQCPIHNGTLKLCLIKYELDVNVNKFKILIILNFNFSTSDLHISNAGKHIIIVRFKLLKLKNVIIFHIIDPGSVKGTIMHRTLPFLHKESLEITLTVPGKKVIEFISLKI